MKKQLFTVSRFLLAVKERGLCADCCGRFPPALLDFDHARGDKAFGLGGGCVPPGTSIEEVAAEVVKCDLVCTNCHRARTSYRKGMPWARAYRERVMREGWGQDDSTS